MIEKEFVSYEIALKLKELGFDEKCLAYFYSKENILDITSSNAVEEICKKFNAIKAPLWQQVIDWFREKYKLYVNIEPKITKEWEFSISELNKGLLFGNKSLYINKNLDFYKAREQAILKAIERI